jgi:prepilin-type processing-associated H-X9-DG protein
MPGSSHCRWHVAHFGLGVTLLEILITVSIMMVIASLIIPLMSWIRQSSLQTSCLNNLRQLGVAVRVYAELEGGRIPASRNWGSLKASHSMAWFHRLPPLMSSRTVTQGGGGYFQCPLFGGKSAGLLANEIPKSYKMNAHIDEVRRRYVPFSIDRISDGEKVALFIDAITTGGMGQWGHAPVSAVDDSRHPGWVSVLYADGRSTAIKSRPGAGWAQAITWESQDWE